MKVTVFYSWQSDLPNNTNRGFIQRALEKAIESIKAQEELVIDPCVERDTAGVSGTPDIASTIFCKIDECHIFVGDVSIINTKTRSGRKTPNPNVLLELGYAAKKLTWDNVVCVFNTAFGKTEELPFDLRLRRMALYSVTEEQKIKAEERDRLASVFQTALQPILLRLNKKVQEDNAPKPLTPDQASAKVKEFLADDHFRIQLSDLVMGVGNELAQRIVRPECPVNLESRITEDVVLQRLRHYEEVSQIALSIMVAGCYWGTQANQKVWSDLLQRVANPTGERGGYTVLLELRRYPALLLLNGGGLAAVAAENYDTMFALFTKPKIANDRTEQYQPPLSLLSSHRVLDEELVNKLTGKRWYAPVSEYLFKLFREPFQTILPDERSYERCFDRFEYLRCLIETDIAGGPHSIGRFGWRWKFWETDVMKEIETEEGQVGRNWPPYKAGWFQGQRERFMAAKKKVSELVARVAWH
jgi:hypothetical protein